MNYEDVRSILILGDSISKGVVLGEGRRRYHFSTNRFVSRLEDAISPGLVDCSKYGTTTEHGLGILDRKFQDGLPDLVFIEYGSNDSDYDWPSVAAHPEGVHLPQISLPAYVRNLRELVSRVRRAGSIPVLTNLHPLVPERYFRWFTRGEAGRQKATMRWLRDVSNIYWWQEMYSYAAQRTADELGVPLIRLREAFLRQPSYQDLICEDGIHPNDKGQSLIYDTILGRIRTQTPGWLERGKGSAAATKA